MSSHCSDMVSWYMSLHCYSELHLNSLIFASPWRPLSSFSLQGLPLIYSHRCLSNVSSNQKSDLTASDHPIIQSSSRVRSRDNPRHQVWLPSRRQCHSLQERRASRTGYACCRHTKRATFLYVESPAKRDQLQRREEVR